MTTNEQLRAFLKETLEYPRECNPLSRRSLLVKIARKILKDVDDKEIIEYAHNNLVELGEHLKCFCEEVVIVKDDFNLEELSEELPHFITRINYIMFAETEVDREDCITYFMYDICELFGLSINP